MQRAILRNGVSAPLLLAVALVATAMSTVLADDATSDQCLRAEHWTQHPQPIGTQWIDNPPLWGTYRPGIYFGLRTRTFPSFLSSGLMWGVSSDEAVGALRHECRQDEFPNWGYTRHDGRHFGSQILNDSAIGAELLTTYITQPSGTSWSARIEASAQTEDQLSLYWYFALDCDGSLDHELCAQNAAWGALEVEERAHEDYSTSYVVRGRSKFAPRLVMEVNVQQPETDTASYRGLARADLLELKATIERGLRSRTAARKRERATSMFEESGDLDGEIDADANLLLFRVGCSGACVVDITFHGELHNDGATQNVATPRDVVSEAIAWGFERFEDQFASTFALPDTVEEADRESAKRALSSQLSGIGFFYGTPDIRDSMEVDQPSPRPANAAPIALFTGTPSRPFFPRGFLWDEGFHLLQLATWDPHMTMYIIAHWLNAMYVHSGPESTKCAGGWIPREMILGAEARTRVPKEFILQHVDIANPPTLLLALEKLIVLAEQETVTCSADAPESCQLPEDGLAEKLDHFLRQFAPALDRWVQWFLRSQAGPEATAGSFRWRGRPTTHDKLLTNTLASGLDDYPRAAIPTTNEYHVDLLAWMIRSCQIMATVKDRLTARGHAVDFSSDYKLLAEQLSSNLDKLHWSEQLRAYADVGMDSKKGQIVSEIVFRCGRETDPSTIDIGVSEPQLRSRSIPCPNSHPRPMFPLGDGHGGMLTRDRYIIRSRAMMHLPRIGYVTLFPMLLKLLPADSPRLGALLDLIESPQVLWTDFGIRSLSKLDLFYDRPNAAGDAPYWRGPIWININFLVLDALHHYSHASTAHGQRAAMLHDRLRQNLIRTILGQQQATGFLWEQYDDKSGTGARAHPFSGWTALVVSVLAAK